ncbi:MAG: flagellar M-ring protein FliF [Acidobacteria bacterium]|nr:flagellar M-ring protein FliF [Acidobacteriota bacterium]
MDPQQLFARLRALTASFTTAQLVTLALAFVLVVGIVSGSAWWLNQPTYALLFADMDPETAGQTVTQLKNLNVAYQLDEGGRGIRVPVERVDELRLQLTAQGMPASGRVGFEIFDRTAFGATEFLEQVNYRRALEGEIARTIGSISEVASARVHIAMGKDSLFGESRPAKASVVLKLRGQRALPASTVAGISNLVSASVDGLRPEAVVILDSFGRPLARPETDADDPLGAAQLERQQRLERDMSARVVALLEPVVGPDRVRVNVALRLNPRSLEETEERWDPETAVVRSRQATADMTNAAPAGAGVVAGARGNTPPSTPPAAGTQAAAASPVAAPPLGAAPAASRSAETTNYEISRTTRRTIQPPGDVARLSVAVIIDDDQVAARGENGQTTVTRTPRKPEDLQKIQDLVAAAVGLEPDRGDQLTVQNVSFDEPVVEEGTPPSILERYAPHVWEGSRMLLIAILGLVALLVFVRPLMRRAGGPVVHRQAAGVAAVMPAPGQPLRTVADLESEIEAQIDAAAAQRAEGRRLPVLTRRVSTLSAKEPENVARLLRSWIAEPER